MIRGRRGLCRMSSSGIQSIDGAGSITARAGATAPHRRSRTMRAIGECQHALGLNGSDRLGGGGASSALVWSNCELSYELTAEVDGWRLDGIVLVEGLNPEPFI